MELYIYLAIPIIFLTAWFYTSAIIQSRIPTLRNKSIVLLIAHPDDEAMFFAPTVLWLTKKELGNHLKILCLSNGNASNLGPTRKREILASARILGLRSDDDVLVLDDPAFQDSMTSHWDITKIADVLSSLFSKTPPTPSPSSSSSSSSPQRKQTPTTTTSTTTSDPLRGTPPTTTINVLITFDRTGISRHPNHTSLYYGAVIWLQNLMKGKTGWECPVTLYKLTSTNVLRKYIALLDVPLTMILCVRDSMRSAGRKGGQRQKRDLPGRLMFLSDLAFYRRAQRAMTHAHVSQMVWFRWGWIGFSRYMLVNDLEREKVVF